MSIVDDVFSRAQSIISESLWKTILWIPERHKEKAAKTIIAAYVTTREIVSRESLTEQNEANPTNPEPLFTGSSFEWYSQIREGLSGRNASDELVNELVRTTTEFKIPHQFIFDFLRGVQQEKSLTHFADFDELRTWAYLTSSSLWLCVVKIVNGQISDDKTLQAGIDLGVVDTLLAKLSDFVPQMEKKKFFISKDEWIDRRLNLENQVQPIDNDLWKNLIQFQCKRLEQRIANIAKLSGLLGNPLRNKFKSIAGTRWALLKKIRRNPELLLRRKIELGKLDRFKSAIRSWLGVNLPKIPAA